MSACRALTLLQAAVSLHHREQNYLGIQREVTYRRSVTDSVGAWPSAISMISSRSRAKTMPARKYVEEYAPPFVFQPWLSNVSWARAESVAPSINRYSSLRSRGIGLEVNLWLNRGARPVQTASLELWFNEVFWVAEIDSWKKETRHSILWQYIL